MCIRFLSFALHPRAPTSQPIAILDNEKSFSLYLIMLLEKVFGFRSLPRFGFLLAGFFFLVGGKTM